MKVRSVMTGLAIALVAGRIATAGANTSQRRLAALRCAESMSMMRAIQTEIHQKNFKEFFVTAPPELGPRGSHLWDEWDGRAPGQDLKDAWSHNRAGSILKCVRARTFEGRPIISAADETRMRSTARPNSSVMFIRIGAPVSNRSGTRALLLYESSGASIGGHAEAYNFERGKNGWRIVGRRILSVS